MERVNFDYSSLKAYYGYYKNTQMLFTSSSGGAATAIAESFLNSVGGYIWGCVYSDGYKRVDYRCASNLDELQLFKGSKYVQANKVVGDATHAVSVYRQVLSQISNGKNVLFIGLPCDVSGLLSVVRNCNGDMDKLFTVDLICHGPTSIEVHKEYLSSVEKKSKSSVDNFSVRYKKKGWSPPYVRADFKDGSILEKNFSSTSYGRAFHLFSRPSCYSCKFRGLGHCADLTIGDYWGLDKGMQEYNHMGVSLLLSKSSKGDELIRNLDSEIFCCNETNIEYSLGCNPNYFKDRKVDGRRETFARDLALEGLEIAVSNSRSFSDVKREFVTSFKRHLPFRLRRYLKRLKGKLKYEL